MSEHSLIVQTLSTALQRHGQTMEAITAARTLLSTIPDAARTDEDSRQERLLTVLEDQTVLLGTTITGALTCALSWDELRKTVNARN